jgi:hypothetical protein
MVNKQKTKHTSHVEGQSSKQGEHIFNAVNDLVKKMKELTCEYAETDFKSKKSFIQANQMFDMKINELERKRDNEAFRSADDGDDQNSILYGEFCESTKNAILKIISVTGNTQDGVTEMNTLCNQLERIAIDRTAVKSKRESLKGKDQELKKFNDWVNETQALMRPLFIALRKFAEVVNNAREADIANAPA